MELLTMRLRLRPLRLQLWLERLRAGLREVEEVRTPSPLEVRPWARAWRGMELRQWVISMRSSDVCMRCSAGGRILVDVRVMMRVRRPRAAARARLSHLAGRVRGAGAWTSRADWMTCEAGGLDDRGDVVRYMNDVHLTIVYNTHSSTWHMNSFLHSPIHDTLLRTLRHGGGLYDTGIPYVGCKIRQDVLDAGCGLELNQLYHCCPGLCLHCYTAVKNGPTETWQFMMNESACTTPHALTMNNLSHRLTMHCLKHYWSLNMHCCKSYTLGWANSLWYYHSDTIRIDKKHMQHKIHRRFVGHTLGYQGEGPGVEGTTSTVAAKIPRGARW